MIKTDEIWRKTNEVDVERKRRKETRGEMTICWDEGKTAERE